MYAVLGAANIYVTSMKLTTTIAITTAMLLLYGTTTNAQDLTRKYRAVGPEVVEDVVDTVRRSCVLPLDNLLLRRLAYVESRDGTDSHTFRSGFFGGIWQVTQTMYDQTKASSYLQQMRAEILSHLMIEWQSTSWQDLQKPLYSGLAAALYIEDTLRTKPHPVGIAAQQNYWAQVYHQGSLPAESFASLAELMESGCHGQADLDIGFVLDTSSSISHQDFEDAKKFIINTTSFFDIDSGLVRVALITYADVARIRVNWDQSRSQVSLDNMISALNYESGGTETAKALNLASQLFANARRNAVKVLVFITDGKSHDAIDTASAATQLQRSVDGGLLLLSVGVGDQVDPNELHSIASDPACKHTFQVASYDQIDAIREEIQRMTCRAPLAVHVNETVWCQLGQCPPYVVMIPPHTTVMVQASTTCINGVKLYSSSTVPYPGSSHYDSSLILLPHAGFSIFNPPPATSRPAHYYVNTDQTVVPSVMHCNVTLSVFLNEVRVVCIDGGRQRSCTTTDVFNFERATGSHLCP
ncbi:uncharacterized protein [Littorina saxatilis]|uniref:uncharacterized protein n=1 Tax=Littorina saxatilis TaxID=31220 RepID=UPI0038B48B31